MYATFEHFHKKKPCGTGLDILFKYINNHFKILTFLCSITDWAKKKNITDYVVVAIAGVCVISRI